MVRIMKCLEYSQKAGEMEILKLEKVLSQVREPKVRERVSLEERKAKGSM